MIAEEEATHSQKRASSLCKPRCVWRRESVFLYNHLYERSMYGNINRGIITSSYLARLSQHRKCLHTIMAGRIVDNRKRPILRDERLTPLSAAERHNCLFATVVKVTYHNNSNSLPYRLHSYTPMTYVGTGIPFCSLYGYWLYAVFYGISTVLLSRWAGNESKQTYDTSVNYLSRTGWTTPRPD